MKLFRTLWADDAGFVVSAELVLVATILVIGMIVGMTSLRNQVVEEMVDVGQAIGSMSQSYALGGVKKCGAFYTDGSCYTDKLDFCQAGQFSGQEPGGICVRVMPKGAGDYPPGGER
jgi:hypothetical protein